jgi:hypothetical protein
MSEYPNIDDASLRILEILASIFPKDASFEQLTSDLSELGDEELLSRIDVMNKRSWIDGALVRTGVDGA